MSTPLHVHLHHERGVPVLSVVGELDLFTAQVLRKRGQALVHEALKPPPQPMRLPVRDHSGQGGDAALPAPGGPDTDDDHPPGQDRTPDAVCWT